MIIIMHSTATWKFKVWEFCEITGCHTVAVCCVDMLRHLDTTRRPNGRTIMNLFQKPKLELYLFKQYFTPPTPPLKQDRSKTNFRPDTSQAHPSYPQQSLSVRFKLCGPMSNRYHDPLQPQAMRFTCLLAFKVKHEPSKSECWWTKIQELWKKQKFQHHLHF